MANVNLYATLAEFKAFATTRGQTMSTDASDDLVIVELLASSSRDMDSETIRTFYARHQTNLYDLPVREGLSLYIDDDDILAVTTLTNGDGSVIASTDYNLYPLNVTPKYHLKLKWSKNIYWMWPASGDTDAAISIEGEYGYHRDYPHAWADVSATLAVAMSDTTSLTFTCTTGKLSVGHIIKIGSEVMNVTTVTVAATDTITVFCRGDNGSTAATHLINAPIYIWVPEELAKNATLELALAKYKGRTGENTTDASTITAGGVVITPKGYPARVQKAIEGLRRIA